MFQYALVSGITLLPYITSIRDEKYLALTSRPLVEEICFLSSWRHAFSLAVHSQRLLFFVRLVKGSDE